MSIINNVVKKMKTYLDTIPEERCPSVMGALFGIVWCHFLYGSNISDYFVLKFYMLNHRARREYITQGDKIYLRYKYNNIEYFNRFENKSEFTKYYGHLMGRDVFHIKNNRNEYLQWISTHTYTHFFIYKPTEGSCGKGIFKLAIDNPKVMDWEYLQQYGDMIVEPFIENHTYIKALNPNTLNTIRIPVLFRENTLEIIGAYLRLGTKNMCTDNFSNGGICAEIDVTSGMVITPGVNKSGQVFFFHPDTGKAIVGFYIPFWEESKSLAIEAAKITMDVRYSSWDIAITPTGPIIIEGNYIGDVDLQQAPAGVGKRYLYREALPRYRRFYFGYRLNR